VSYSYNDGQDHEATMVMLLDELTTTIAEFRSSMESSSTTLNRLTWALAGFTFVVVVLTAVLVLRDLT